MVPLAGNEIFDSFSPVLAVLSILTETVSSKSLSNLDFIIESILANYKKNFMYPKDSYKILTEIAFIVPRNTATPYSQPYSEILVPNTPVLKIIMSILLSISGSTGFRVVILKRLVPRERISSGGCYVSFSHLGHSDQVLDHD